MRRDADAGIGDGDGQTDLGIELAGHGDLAAGRGELDRIGDQVEQHLLGLALVATQRRQIVGKGDLIRERRLVDAPGGQLPDRAHDVAQVEHVLGELDFSRFGLRQVEDVVDDLQQVGAAGVDVADIGAVLLVAERAQHLAQHHLGKADDRVQGRAQLVAHGREKAGFGLVGRLGLFLGLAQRLVGRLAVALQADAVEAAVEHREQRLRIDRFVEIIVRAAAQRRDRGLGIELGGHQHADQIRVVGAHPREQVDPRSRAEALIDQRHRRSGPGAERPGDRFHRRVGIADDDRPEPAQAEHVGE